MHFSWDPQKAASNSLKHGISFEEAETVFDDPLAIVVPDAVHAWRWLIVGLSERRRALVVVHEEISESEVRLVSARKATAHERRRYEEGTEE